jgi:hypothetical protein
MSGFKNLRSLIPVEKGTRCTVTIHSIHNHPNTIIQMQSSKYNHPNAIIQIQSSKYNHPNTNAQPPSTRARNIANLSTQPSDIYPRSKLPALPLTFITRAASWGRLGLWSWVRVSATPPLLNTHLTYDTAATQLLTAYYCLATPCSLFFSFSFYI